MHKLRNILVFTACVAALIMASFPGQTAELQHIVAPEVKTLFGRFAESDLVQKFLGRLPPERAAALRKLDSNALGRVLVKDPDLSHRVEGSLREHDEVSAKTWRDFVARIKEKEEETGEEFLFDQACGVALGKDIKDTKECADKAIERLLRSGIGER